MGSMGALGMANAVNDGLINLYAAIDWHVKYNHYPPPRNADQVVDLCVDVVRMASEGDYGTIIPADYVDGGNPDAVDIRRIMDALHLWDFVDADEYDEED